jgi:hypothetical protein
MATLRLSTTFHRGEWTCSIAVHSRVLIEHAKDHLRFRAKEREVIAENEGYHPREGSAPYNAFFRDENDDIGLKNTYFWGINTE